MTPVRILIADDHEVVRQGVRAVLEAEPSWMVCGEARSGREALAKAVELRPDVVVLDVSMPELNGLEATRQLRAAVPTKILILTVHDSEQVVTEVLEAGADGYVLKSDAGRKLVEAIRALLKNRPFFTDGVRAVATRPPRRRGIAVTPDAARLTARQREVLQLVTERGGQLRAIRDGALDPNPVAGVPAVRAAGLGGLMDVTLHPKFGDNRYVYLSYTKDAASGSGFYDG